MSEMTEEGPPAGTNAQNPIVVVTHSEQEVQDYVATMLSQMEHDFEETGTTLVTRMQQMGTKMDGLEQSITGLMHDAGLEEEEEDDDDDEHAYTTTENTTDDDKINMVVDGGSGGLSPPLLSAMKEPADHRHRPGSTTKAAEPTPPSPRRQTNMDINDILCSSSPTASPQRTQTLMVGEGTEPILPSGTVPLPPPPLPPPPLPPPIRVNPPPTTTTTTTASSLL